MKTKGIMKDTFTWGKDSVSFRMFPDFASSSFW